MMPRANNLFQCISMLIIIVFSLVACQRESHKDLHQYANKIKARQKPKVEPMPKMVKVERYVYQNHEKNVIHLYPWCCAIKKGKPNSNRQKQALENFPLDSLRMVGTLRQDKKLWAIVTAPNGRAYHIKIGDYLGQNFGQVEAISKHTVEIIESVPTATGWKKRPASLSFEQAEDQHSG